jgi:hypothetical protein
MAVKSKKITDKITEATEQAKDNPYLQKIVEDKELRDNAVAALQSVKTAFDRAQEAGLDKPADLVNDKKLRKELKSAADTLKQTKQEIKAAGKPKKKKGGFGKLLVIGVIGAVAAIVISEDLRKQVLDALFGAEEEFEYTSTTSASSTNGAA